MNYGKYGLALFLSTSILGSIIFILMVFLVEPMLMWYVMGLYAMVLPSFNIIFFIFFHFLFNFLLVMITIVCVKYLKLKQHGGFYSALIYTGLLIFVFAFPYAKLLKDGAKGGEILIVLLAIATFLSALFASIWLPKAKEQPENLAES